MQAEPDDTATSLSPISIASPSTYAKLMLRLPGSRCSIEPFTKVSVTCDWIPSRRRSRSAKRRLPSLTISAPQSSAALPKPTIGRDVQRPRAHPALVPAAVDLRRDADARLAADVQRADALGPVHLVRRQRRQVDARGVDVEGNLPDALHGVDVEERAPAP